MVDVSRLSVVRCCVTRGIAVRRGLTVRQEVCRLSVTRARRFADGVEEIRRWQTARILWWWRWVR